jgi:hypothetical protein
MSTRKSPIYSILAVLFSLVILAGGAAKLYRGISGLSESGAAPKVRELLVKSDSSAEEANRQSAVVAPLFQDLLGEFDQMGLAAFRTEKRNECEKVSAQYVAVAAHLRDASKSILEATKHGTDAKTSEFLLARSESYECLIRANEKNIEIISVILDQSISDTDAVIEKVHSIATQRGEDEKASQVALATSNQVLKQPR